MEQGGGDDRPWLRSICGAIPFLETVIDSRQQAAGDGQHNIAISFLGRALDLAPGDDSLKLLQADHKRQKEDLNEMSSQFVTFATFVRGLEAKTAEPIEGWYQEVVKSFEMLVEQNSAVKAALEEVKDAQKKQNLGKLDEQAKTLQLEEEGEALRWASREAKRELYLCHIYVAPVF